MYIAIVSALYLYFNGNCRFDKYRMYNEDDQADDADYKRGLAVLVLCLFEAGLNFSWPVVYFKRQEYGRASIMLVIMIVFNIIIMTMMGTTEKCLLDYLTNRYYISVGLYLVYTAWLTIALVLTLYTYAKRNNIKKGKTIINTNVV